MDREAIDSRLALGKEAARRGDDALALRHLQEVVEIEPENEDAWLWLSAVVEDYADKQLCLENVLVLNPQNQAARRGLERIAAIEAGGNERAGQRIERQVEPLTPASAILYPERQNKSWHWHDPIELQQTSVAQLSSELGFDDVWQRTSELCAYCATELEKDDNRCPGCKRNLVETEFRYPKASSDLTVYWVLILGIAQLALVTVLLNLVGGGSPASLAWQSLVFLTIIVLVVGLSFRRFWAYVGSILALLLILAAMIVGPSLGPSVDDSLSQLAGRAFFLRLGENPYEMFLNPVGSVLRLLQYVAVPLALIYALFRVGPDFERVTARRIAQLDRGVSDAPHHNSAGKAYADRGMWASAVMHFQRAAALEPAKPFYQRQLGEAYAELGHYQRCLDVLESARQLTRDPETKVAISRTMDGVRQQMRFTEIDRAS